MPVATTTALAIAGTVAAGAGVATSAAQAKRGKKMAGEAQQALDEYQRQDLRNVYAGLELPMEGIRLQEEQIQQAVGTQVGQLSRAGARGLVGGLPQVQDWQAQQVAQLGAQLEESKFKIEQMIAQDEARIQQMEEQRERADIAGLGQQLQVGREMRAAGQASMIQGIGQTLTSGITAAGELGAFGDQTTLPKTT
jgi:hypothetical protein